MGENRELALVLKLVADQFKSELKNSQSALGQFNSFIADWKTQLAAAGVVLFGVAKSTADYGDALVKASQRMGTSIEDTARIQHAAKLADTDLQGLTNTVGFLAKNMLEAVSGNVDAGQTFYRLGINVRDSNGNLKDTTQVLLELNDTFRRMPDGPEKTALAMKALGKSGKDVLPFLNSDLREAFQEADRLGLVMSEKDAKAAEHFNDEITKLQGAIRGVTNDIGTALIPKFDAITHALTTIITDAREAAKALTGLGKAEVPQAGVVKPEGGGRSLRILPPPPGIEKAQVDRVIPTEQDLKKLQEDYHLYITGLTAMGQERLDKEKAGYQLYITGLTAMGNEHLTKQREGYHLYITGLTAMGEEVLAKQRAGYQLYIQGLTQAGQDYLNKIKGTGDEAVQLFQGHQKELEKGRKIIQDNAQAWVTYYEQVGGSADGLYTARMDLIRANLAQELTLTEEQSAKLLIAWQNRDYEAAEALLARTNKTATEIETIELRTLQASTQAKRAAGGDFAEGWAIGMSRYVNDTTSAFGLAVDMARRTAQMMEQSFRTFFFDFFEGRIQSLKDVLRSFGNFVKQLMAQVMAQIATMMVIKGLTSVFGGPAGGLGMFTGDVMSPLSRNGGGMILAQRFDVGGMVRGFGNIDSVPAALTPGEGVLSRRGMAALDRLNHGGDLGGGFGNVTVNVINPGQAEKPMVNLRRTLEGPVIDIIWKNYRENGSLRTLFQGGAA